MNTKKHLFFVFALLTMILVACKPETDVKHTVTYKDSQLKTLDTHIVQSGNTDIPPATNEEKEGLDFIGWSLDENGEKLFDFNTPITSDITLYPIWEVNALYKSKSFEVRFIYYDQEPITTRTYKTGNRISISNLGFNIDDDTRNDSAGLPDSSVRFSASAPERDVLENIVPIMISKFSLTQSVHPLTTAEMVDPTTYALLICIRPLAKCPETAISVNGTSLSTLPTLKLPARSIRCIMING